LALTIKSNLRHKSSALQGLDARICKGADVTKVHGHSDKLSFSSRVENSKFPAAESILRTMQEK
jgi:hypothetical protein